MTFQIKQNDTLPRIRAALLTSTGAPLNLTGASVSLQLSHHVTHVTTPHAATVIDAPGGIVEYSWVAGDTAEAATFDGEWRVTFVDGVQTVPGAGVFQVTVRPRL